MEKECLFYHIQPNNRGGYVIPTEVWSSCEPSFRIVCLLCDSIPEQVQLVRR